MFWCPHFWHGHVIKLNAACTLKEGVEQQETTYIYIIYIYRYTVFTYRCTYICVVTYTYTYILERLYSCGHWHPSCIAHAAHVVRLCGTPYAYSQTLPIWIEIVWRLSGQSTGQGSNEAPQPTDCHTTAAMTDIVVAPKWDLAHTIKSNMVDLCLQRQCVTVAIPTLSPCIKHVYIYIIRRRCTFTYYSIYYMNIRI